MLIASDKKLLVPATLVTAIDSAVLKEFHDQAHCLADPITTIVTNLEDVVQANVVMHTRAGLAIASATGAGQLLHDVENTDIIEAIWEFGRRIMDQRQDQLKAWILFGFPDTPKRVKDALDLFDNPRLLHLHHPRTTASTTAEELIRLSAGRFMGLCADHKRQYLPLPQKNLLDVHMGKLIDFANVAHGCEDTVRNDWRSRWWQAKRAQELAKKAAEAAQKQNSESKVPAGALAASSTTTANTLNPAVA